MSRQLILVTAALCAMAAATAANAKSPRQVFAAHDPDGRLPNTKIERLGKVAVKGATYSIYYLTFVNPASHHGQQRIAIIRNGHHFAGAYQCWLGDGGARLVIGKDRLTAYVEDLVFVIKFDGRGPSRNKYFCGEGSGWENGI